MEDVGGLPAKAKVAKVDEGLNGYGEGAIALPDALPLLASEDDPLVYGVSLASCSSLQGHLTRDMIQ